MTYADLLLKASYNWQLSPDTFLEGGLGSAGVAFEDAFVTNYGALSERDRALAFEWFCGAAVLAGPGDLNDLIAVVNSWFALTGWRLEIQEGARGLAYHYLPGIFSVERTEAYEARTETKTDMVIEQPDWEVAYRIYSSQLPMYEFVPDRVMAIKPPQWYPGLDNWWLFGSRNKQASYWDPQQQRYFSTSMWLHLDPVVWQIRPEVLTAVSTYITRQEIRGPYVITPENTAEARNPYIFSGLFSGQFEVA